MTMGVTLADAKRAARDAALEEAAEICDAHVRELITASNRARDADDDQTMYRVNTAIHRVISIAAKIRSLKEAS